jgi:hypothetical protein
MTMYVSVRDRLALRPRSMFLGVVVVEKKTIRRVDLPTVLLVGLTEGQVDRCRRAMATLAMRVVRVAHTAAACERIPVVMPCVVVVDEALHPDERARIDDAVAAVGAQLLPIKQQPDPAELARIFREAGERASKA